jgi:hypothetical protein
VLPAASVAVQLTGLSPIGKLVSETGAQFAGRRPSTKALAVGWVQLTRVLFAMRIQLRSLPHHRDETYRRPCALQE